MKKNRLTLGYMLLAYIFVFVFHLYWIYWAHNISEFYWHGQLMINNVDGYYFGSGAQRILDGMHLDNPRLDGIWHYGVAILTAYVAKFFNITIDSVMLYMPALVSSLVVIPIILIGKLYKNINWGFLAAIIGGIGWSYYNRTLAGYYDTDMFSASLPMFILYFLLKAIKDKSILYTLIAGITVIVYPWFYDQGLSIVYAMGIMAFIYMLVFHFKEEFTYKFIILFSISLFAINPIIRIGLIIGLYFLLTNKDFKLKELQIISIIGILIFFYTGNVFGMILGKIFSYSTNTTSYDSLKFLNVNRTISEASHIPWNIVFDRIIGSTVGLMIAVIGYVLLVKKYKEFIIAFPLWGIGFFAFVGGLRFTVYAVPIAAISGIYFFIWIVNKLQKGNIKQKVLILIGGTLFLIAPNITHIVGCCEKSSTLSSIKKIYPLSSYPYLVPTTFKKTEVDVLNKLKQNSNDKDYAITWWDYGYPIWYYADVNTLIDGGKHNEDNFIVSKILTTDNPILAYNLSKVSIKKYVDTNKTVAPQLFIKNNKPIDVSDYLAQLSDKNFKAPKLNRDIYLILPYRMFNILPTVAIFSNRDINTGATYRNHFFYKSRFQARGTYIKIGRFMLNLKTGSIRIGNKNIPIKHFDIVSYDKKGHLMLNKQKANELGLNIIILKSYGEAIIVDDFYYNSTFIQMFVFQNYNKKLFKPVVLNPFMKIYKLK